jgi:hypothetical protein
MPDGCQGHVQWYRRYAFSYPATSAKEDVRYYIKLPRTGSVASFSSHPAETASRPDVLERDSISCPLVHEIRTYIISLVRP